MVPKESADRVVFFDNIRYLMVLLVVVLHSALGYSNNASCWTVNDENSILKSLEICDIPIVSKTWPNG